MEFVLRAIQLLHRYFSYRGFWDGIKDIIKRARKEGETGLRFLFIEIKNVPTLSLSEILELDYVVTAPDFVSNSAGIRCLYDLCADLVEKGFNVAITGSGRTCSPNPIPIISSRNARRAAKCGAWVLYPEVISGNPIGAKNVIRWVLNKPGYLGGDTVFGEDERVFIYSDVFAPYVQNKISGKLYKPTLDLTLFFEPAIESPRSLVCYYIGKANYKEGYVDRTCSFEIDRTTPQRKQLGTLFRHAKVLYCFDNSTALIYEAVLCGCPVVVIPDGSQTLEDYQKLELGMHGIYWDMPGSLPSSVNPQKLREVLAAAQAAYDLQLENLINLTQPSLRDGESQKRPETSFVGEMINE